MVVSGAWPQPKIRPTLLLFLVAAAGALTPLELKANASSGTSEESRHIGAGLETTSPSADLTSNHSEPSADLTSNSPGPSAELTSTSPGPSAELTSNSPGPSAELTSTSPGPSAELTTNSTEPSAKLAGHPPTAAQQELTTTQTLAMKEPVVSVSPSALPSTEAALALGSGQAGATAAGGKQPVTNLTREGLKGQAGTVPGSPGPGQETQTLPGRSGQNESAPTERAKAKGIDRSGDNRTVPASTDRTGRYRENQPTPELSPSALSPTPPVNKKPDSKAPAPSPTPTSTTSSSTRQLPVGIIVVLVVVAILVLALLALALHCRKRRRSGSTSFSGRAGPGEWAGPVSLPEEKGEGQAGDGGQQAGPGEARRPTLTTFFGKRHSRVSSVAMEDVAGAKGEGPLSEPLLAAGEQGGDPTLQGAGEANGTLPLMPGPPSPPPDPPANGEFPLPPPMEQEAMPPV
ncbi:leukosialin [Terrapene carolina triunguis]|uniref:Leukosialin n=1 Tax=Terrapene triunguis TaxID=2587831 RepID=A0A674JD76_9SAUR|nr:leukosialin [Terrapene carolina triunguis]